MDFPSLQIVFVSILWIVFWLLSDSNGGWFSTLVAIAVFAVLVYQARLIYPYTELHRQEVDNYLFDIDGDKDTLKLLSCNVLMTNRDSSRLLSMIRHHNPDVFITLESDEWWQKELDTLDDYSYAVKCPMDNLYGMHVYSRLPLHESAIHFKVEDDKPSISTRIEVNDQQWVNLHCVHPAPPAPMENSESTERDVELLLLAKNLADNDKPTIVTGDLNDVAWSATTQLFRQISGLLDPRIGRGLFNTFNAFHWFARWPLDHVFLSNHFKVISMDRLPKMGSDHFPLLIELAVMRSTDDESGVIQEAIDEERLDSIMNSSVAKEAQ